MPLPSKPAIELTMRTRTQCWQEIVVPSGATSERLAEAIAEAGKRMRQVSQADGPRPPGTTLEEGITVVSEGNEILIRFLLSEMVA